MRRGENGIQFSFGVRKLSNSKSKDFIESIIVIQQRRQIEFLPHGTRQKFKDLYGVTLSKIYMFLAFGWIYSLDQIRSDGFSCRNLKDGAEFLLSNDTKPANYLNAKFSQIWEMKRENGKGVAWGVDPVNGLFTDSMSELNSDFHKSDFKAKFSRTADLIDSFNLFGFHDVCNVLTWSDLTFDHLLLPWFGIRNAKGTFYQK